MLYEIDNLALQVMLPAIGRAEDQLARLDEIVRRSGEGAGFSERAHFFDAAATMWVGGELVHMEDLVLHDARMDIRAPTHELMIAHGVMRARRRIAGAEPDWAISDSGWERWDRPTRQRLSTGMRKGEFAPVQFQCRTEVGSQGTAAGARPNGAPHRVLRCDVGLG